MERRHQVFVSSTYTDLIIERQNVIQVLLELDCMPAGMELFPAADEDSWSLIRAVIDDSDYYVVVLGGRYGSIGSEGLSYTEMEYDYALSIGKPVIGFIHEDPGSIPSGHCESTDDGKEKLAQFREKVQARQCKYWANPDDLGSKVLRSLVQLRKKHPSDGWVPGRFAADDKMLREIAELRRQVEKLSEEPNVSRGLAPDGAAGLAQGEATILFSISARLDDGQIEKVRFEASWNNLLRYVGPSLLGECDDELFHNRIKLCFYHGMQPEFEGRVGWSSLTVPYLILDQITVQLQALGYLAVGVKRRTPSDLRTYWKLTPYGEDYLIQLRAWPKGKGEIAEEDVVEEQPDESSSVEGIVPE